MELPQWFVLVLELGACAAAMIVVASFFAIFWFEFQKARKNGTLDQKPKPWAALDEPPMIYIEEHRK